MNLQIPSWVWSDLLWCHARKSQLSKPLHLEMALEHGHPSGLETGLQKYVQQSCMHTEHISWYVNKYTARWHKQQEITYSTTRLADLHGLRDWPQADAGNKKEAARDVGTCMDSSYRRANGYQGAGAATFCVCVPY